MSTGANKNVARRFFEDAFNRADMRVADEVIAESVVDHDLLIYHQPGSGKDGIKEGIRMLHIAFPDLHAEVEELLAEDNRVMVRLIMTGTK